MDNDKITGKVAVVGSGNQGLSKAAMSVLTVPLLVSAMAGPGSCSFMPGLRLCATRPPIRFFSCPCCGKRLEVAP